MSVYIIAEIGVNHDGNLDKAHKLIDAAADAGADAVKFQTYRADELAVAGPHRDMLAKYQMPLAWYPELKKHAIDRGVEFGSSVFDVESAIFIKKLGVDFIKVGSGEITHDSLLQYLAFCDEHVILSTGMATEDEVDSAFGILKSQKNHKRSLLHCVSCYPAIWKDYNFSTFDALTDLNPYKVGISDHTIGMELPIIGSLYGMDILERHITLSRNDEGPDHKASTDPFSFLKMVTMIRDIKVLRDKIAYQSIDGEVTYARRVQTPEGFKRNP